MSTQRDQQSIGRFIEDLREQRGMTQEALAAALKTSQSAVARMENGEQNFTTAMLAKISRALGREVMALSSGMSFRIRGGKKLSGSVRTNTAKNSAVALLCASLLNRAPTTIKRIARIEEVFRILEVLESIGVKVHWKGGDVQLSPPRRFSLEKLNRAAAVKTRSALMLIGSLVHARTTFVLPFPGGCELGKRSVRAHEYALAALGVTIRTNAGEYHIAHRALRPAEIILYESSDTATINTLLAAAKIPGITVMKYASANYQVQDICHYLRQLGVRVEGIGTTTLVVHGRPVITTPVTVHPGEDPIESMLFLAVAATTKSSITIERCPIDFLELELMKLATMGFRHTRSAPYLSKNGHTRLVDITTHPSSLRAPEDKLYGRPYPGLNIDNLPFFAPIATQAKGTTLLHDWVYENRAIYFMELAKLGARCILADPHRMYIEGPTTLHAAEVICPPALRPAVIILIAMLAAEGESILRNVYSINRGYEDLCARLASLGADIRMVPSR